MNHICGTITKYLTQPRKNKNNSYWVYLELKNDKKIIKISGITNFLPKQGDYIDSKTLSEKNDYGSYDLKSFCPHLPRMRKYQQERINDIIGYTLDNKIMKKILNEDVWINIMNKTIELNEEDYNKLSVYIIAYEKNYKMEILRNYLIKIDCKLNDAQLDSICNHEKFGPEICKWNKKELYNLFDIDGISYITVMKIAEHFQLSKIDKTIIKVIKELDYSSDCHVYLPKTEKSFNITKELFIEAIKVLEENKKIYILNKIIYSGTYFKKEMFIAQDLIKRQNIDLTFKKSKLVNIKEVKHFLSTFTTINKFQLNDEQKHGILNVFNNNVSIIIGKAGTGKSSILEGLTKCVELLNLNQTGIELFFITPTAKAAIRIKEIIGNKYNAKTIHSFCNSLINPKTLHIENLNDKSIIIIDEATMIDNNILYNLLSIIRDKNCKLLLLGDSRQLPSIGPGDVFNKILKTEYFPITELTQVYRSSKNLNKILDDILNERMPESDGTDFIWLEPQNNIEQLLIDNIKTNNSLHIIATTNKFINSTTDQIRQILNPYNSEQREYTHYETIFREGDVVVHCKNDNEKELYNGMIGKIISIEKPEETEKFMEIKYDNRRVKYDRLMINDIKLAYILTVHKSQGQEYDNVLVILENDYMVNKNLLYTALSRAKKKIILISKKQTLQNALLKNCPKRNSLLNLMFNIFNNEINNNIIKNNEIFINIFKEYYN